MNELGGATCGNIIWSFQVRDCLHGFLTKSRKSGIHSILSGITSPTVKIGLYVANSGYCG
ncbi:MAG: hypothetical protein P8184_10770 [Calditrichia bacterium]